MKGAAAMNQSMPKNLYHSPPFHVSQSFILCFTTVPGLPPGQGCPGPATEPAHLFRGQTVPSACCRGCLWSSDSTGPSIFCSSSASIYVRPFLWWLMFYMIALPWKHNLPWNIPFPRKSIDCCSVRFYWTVKQESFLCDSRTASPGWSKSTKLSS